VRSARRGLKPSQVWVQGVAERFASCAARGAD